MLTNKGMILLTIKRVIQITNSQQLQQALTDNFNTIQRLEQQDHLDPNEFKRLNDLKQQRMKLQNKQTLQRLFDENKAVMNQLKDC